MKLIKQEIIESRIIAVRGAQVMFDSDLATLYQVETKVLNQAVKRNLDRFPESFRFQLTQNEARNYLSSESLIIKDDENLKSQIVTSSSEHGGRRTLPYVFTEQGVAMLSAVLRSDVAVQVSIQIMNAFVQMRKMVTDNAVLFHRLDKLEGKQFETDQKFEQIFKALESRTEQPDKGIFFDGQVFDAYVFVADIIKKAKTNIILIDNYVDETVLILLAKRNKGVSVTIFTKTISKALQLDITKHNAQYQKIEVHVLTESHDRFLIIDHKELYHLGASLKDLGKKWFAFSKMDSLTNEVLAKLQ